MNPKQIIIMSLFGVALVGCKERQGEIEYNAEIVDAAPKTDATLRKIDSEMEFGFPETIEFVSDSMMLVFDTNANDYMCHIIDTNGRHISSFGKKGRGEGEIVSPMNVTVSERKDSAFIYDFMLQRLVGFDLGQVIRGENQIPSTLQIDINTIPDQQYRFTHVKSGSEGSIIGFGIENNRMVIMRNGVTQSTYTEYPIVDPDEETNNSIWNYGRDLRSCSPDRTKLVVCTYVGGLFEILNFSSDVITSKTVKGFYKPIYKYADGIKPKCVVPDHENLITGFRSVSAGDSDFVTVIDGPESKRIDEILTFDYDGNLTRRTVVDNGFINILGRNPKGEIYCVAWDRDFQEESLYKVELKE